MITPWIRAIDRAATEDLARTRLDDFAAERGRRYPAIGQAWRGNWGDVVPFFAFPPAIRYRGESGRKLIKTRGSFPTEAAITLLLPGHPERRRALAKSH